MKEADKLPHDEIEGLGTNFKSENLKIAPKGTVELDNLLMNLEKNTLEILFDADEIRKACGKDELADFTTKFLEEMKEQKKILMPKDKTNGHVVMDESKYED